VPFGTYDESKRPIVKDCRPTSRVEAPRAPGIWGASLAALLPDFVVFDAGLTPAAGQQVLGAARVLAAGFFERDWRCRRNSGMSRGQELLTGPSATTLRSKTAANELASSMDSRSRLSISSSIRRSWFLPSRTEGGGRDIGAGGCQLVLESASRARQNGPGV
jgi:hypothetical protein